MAFAGPDEREQANLFLKAVSDRLLSESQDVSARQVLRTRITAEVALPIRDLAAVIGELSVFVGNDSGPRHLAVAVGTPTVTLFGPEHPFEWHPYPPERHPFFFVDNLACRRDALPGMPAWCALDTCVVEKHQCMTRIDLPSVYEAARKVARP